MWKCDTCREENADKARQCKRCGTERPVVTADVDQLVFVGLNGYALALDRDTGEVVWSNSEMKSGYVSLLLDGDRLIVSTNGYIYCLDPQTGHILWNNPLRGFGMGAPTSLASVRGKSPDTLIQQAAQRISQQRSSGT